MVLKRLLATALGAFGLGALAAGTASGQTAGEGNIPAPNIFDDQITCSMNVPSAMDTPTPTMVSEGGMTSPLDVIIGMGNRELNTTTLTSTADQQTLMDLGYVIPPTGANCGLGAPAAGAAPADLGMQASFVDGYDEDSNGMYDGENDVAPTGAIPADVAAGYSDLLTKFMAVYGNPGDNDSTGTAGALAAAQKALSDQIERGTEGSALEPFQEAVTEAQDAHTKARAAFNDIAGGPIYQAGVAEWMAKATVTKSIVDYNAQVVKANMAKADLDALDFGSYVPLGNPELVGVTGETGRVVTIAANGMATVNLDQLIQYTNSDLDADTLQVGTHGMAGMGTGDGSEGNDAAVGSVTTESNFDASGKLILPTIPNTTNPAALAPNVIADGTANQVDAIRTRVEQVNAAATALKKARDEHTGTNQRIYDEAYRRAQLEADYYNAMWAKVLADNTDLRTAAQKGDSDGDGTIDDTEQAAIDDGSNTAYVKDPITIAGHHAAYTSESNKRFTAEQTLRSAVATREAATAAVRTAFNSPQAFYEQLVARRTALKAAADKVVAGAETPTEMEMKDAADAAKALMEAETKKADFDALFDDPNDPKVALINELLKTGGDDGQAIADAISSNYDTANEAKMTADQVAEQVSGLTGDEGAVAMNTERSMQNESDIEDLDGRVSMNEGEIWDADGNSRIDANEDRSKANEMEIGMDENGMSRIDHNEERSMANHTRSMDNEMEIGMDVDGMSRIDHNERRSMANDQWIMDNSSRLDSAYDLSMANESAINGLTGRVGSAESAISRNETAIMGLQDQMEIVRAGVAASMALAGMPAINGRGISIGVGSFDGESAFAVGFQIQGEMASFKVGVTSAGGETGASAGVGFQF